jgi:hypothetical protein
VSLEAFRRDAHDHQRDPVETDHVTNHVAARAEARAPQRTGDDGDGVGSGRAILFRVKRAACHGDDSQQGEVSGGYDFAHQAIGACPISQREACEPVRSQRFERAARVREIPEIRC